MCNLYDMGPAGERWNAVWQRGLAKAIAAASKSHGIRKTDPAIVGRLSDEGTEIAQATMRWGFHRPFNPAINNARSDKLNGPMWDDAWTKKRRCLIPVSTFYEWTGPTGAKHTHAFQMPADSFWMAGLWENNPDKSIGASFSMLTTSASQQVEQIHNRMPAILVEKDIDEFFHAENPLHLIQPYSDELTIFECENPLKMRPEDHQGPIPISMLPGF